MAQEVNITRAIEDGRVTPYQYMIYALCTLLCLSDGVDTFLPAIAGPAMRTEFNLGPEALGSIFSAGLAGNLVGYFMGGPLSDRFGRRWLMVVNAAVFTLFTMLSAMTSSFEQLLVMRFLCGIGLAICLSSSLAMIADFSKARWAVPLVIVAQVGFSVGSILVHSGAAYLVPHYGWRSTFYVGSGLGLLMTILLLLLMPESIRYLALRRPTWEGTGKVLSRITGNTYAAGTRFALEGEEAGGAPLVELFRHGRLARSIALWIMFFAGGCMVFTLTQWLPSLLKTAGLPFTTAVAAGAAMGSAGTTGSLVTTLISARVKRPVVLVCIQFFLAAIGLIAIGFAGNTESLVYASVIFTGFFLISGWLLMYAVATTAYPDFMRATGLSMSTVWGRAGAIVGPLVVGKMLASGFGTQAVFTTFGSLSAVTIVGGLLYLASRRESNPTLEHLQTAKA
jgi:AAHS family 4-hydroxybenzoate transporter-like MFS transporter